ncbi:hypothetical protein [Pseudidiomarina donghaiensis]|uniref:hypothetical protein n=1 Tax=Pseudidiomarina donghaiensis TaxID=519452 RepID=UPI0008E49AC3|nr:hypothetical protein [Pseudidiomarina donghaiensis]SFV24055.1 hypothetical protein SAMN04488139_2107 [Pseudidiomarina donghaiensis]
MQTQQGSTPLLRAFVLVFLFIISFSAFAQTAEDCNDPVVMSGTSESSSNCEPTQPIEISPKLIAPWAQSGGLVADAYDGVVHGLSLIQRWERCWVSPVYLVVLQHINCQ